jgi:uncharacterized membrane protein YraQ (UPF0718 family)
MVDVDAPQVGRRDLPLIEILAAVTLAAVALRPVLATWFDRPAIQNFTTIFIAVTVQAVPFLVLGVVVSASIATFLPPGLVARLLPRHAALAVPAAALAGVALPGCECGSVPIASRLVSTGTPPAAALTFLLAAPAVNPVVMVATAVAFPGHPEMVLGRFAASLMAATVVGWVWARFGDDSILRRHAAEHREPERVDTFLHAMRHDFLQAGGYLVVGAAMAAALQTVVPRSILDTVASHGVLAVLALAVLAVLLAVCSEADAFVAAGLSQFSLTARLVFLTVGPMVDVKLVALQIGTFGRSFAIRFAPLTWVVAVASGSLVGWILL